MSKLKSHVDMFTALSRSTRAFDNPGKAIRISAGQYYFVNYHTRTLFRIERQGNQWYWENGSAELSGTAKTLNEIIDILSEFPASESIYIDCDVYTFWATSHYILVRKRSLNSNYNPVVLYLNNNAPTTINTTIARKFIMTSELPDGYEN